MRSHNRAIQPTNRLGEIRVIWKTRRMMMTEFFMEIVLLNLKQLFEETRWEEKLGFFGHWPNFNQHRALICFTYFICSHANAPFACFLGLLGVPRWGVEKTMLMSTISVCAFVGCMLVSPRAFAAKTKVTFRYLILLYEQQKSLA